MTICCKMPAPEPRNKYWAIENICLLFGKLPLKGTYETLNIHQVIKIPFKIIDKVHRRRCLNNLRKKSRSSNTKMIVHQERCVYAERGGPRRCCCCWWWWGPFNFPYLLRPSSMMMWMIIMVMTVITSNQVIDDAQWSCGWWQQLWSMMLMITCSYF